MSPSGPRPTPRPADASGEFVAPARGIRLRGSSERPDEPDEVPAAAAPTGSRSAPARHDELRLCGLAAVKARFARDPNSIKRLFFDRETGQRVGAICRVLAREKKVYRQVEPDELAKIAGSIHHGGIVAVVYLPPLRTPTGEGVRGWAKRGEALLILDRIGNAHNLGAVARTAAFFGVPRLVIPDDPGAARPNDAAYRVAEGGFEHLEVWRVPDLVGFVRELAHAGFDVVGAATRGGKLGGKTGDVKASKPVALILGNEEQGLAPDVVAACSRVVTIPGTGAIESLNVSVAAAVLMWELLAKPREK
ncbi:MAG: methyltransferase [Verrucomicrobia bacterium]|nr:methyltransferase [Verrucomicrobiota bacterium]